MSRKDKLLGKLFQRPKNMTWLELCKVLQSLGFEKKQGSGSRVKFFHPGTKQMIILHNPHPGNTVAHCYINYVVDLLKEMGIRP
jgi:predicted RNA binding protein YcfA (HicA-like mRNA interferase family)